MKRLIEEALRMLRIDSITSNGNEELVNYALFLLQTKGIKAHTQQVLHSLDEVSRQQFNVIGVLGDPLVDRKTRKGLLLLAPLDTVASGLATHWNLPGMDPFSPVVSSGEASERLIGLGAASGKLDFLCKVHAAKKFVDRKLKTPIYVVGVCGSELGEFGGRYLLQSLALNPRFTLVGAPTDLNLVRAHKSLSVFRASIDFHTIERGARGFNRRVHLASYGRAAHGAYPDQGVNAMLQLMDFVQLAMDNGFEIQFTSFQGGASPGTSRGGALVTANGGFGVNQVPDEAEAEFFLTSHQLEDFKRFFREASRQMNAEGSGRENAFKIEFGGLGDTGISFLPEVVFQCLSELAAFPRKLATSRLSGQESSGMTANVGRIKQLPNRLEIWFEIRLPTHLSAVELMRSVEQGVASIGARFPSLNLNVRRERHSPGLSVPEAQPFAALCNEALDAAGVPPSVAVSGPEGEFALATEAGLFAQKGYDALAFGPGSAKGNAHSPNESVRVADLERAIQFYEQVIERVCERGVE